MCYFVQGVSYLTERCHFGKKYIGIGGYVPDITHVPTYKFDFPVIVDSNQYALLNDLLNVHVQRKLGRDMLAMESVDAGSLVFGPKFAATGKQSDDYHAVRFKIKSKPDELQRLQPKLSMRNQMNGNSTEITDINDLKSTKSIVLFETFFIKETVGAIFKYRWSLNIAGACVLEDCPWLDGSTIPENLPDDLTKALTQINDPFDFFSDSTTEPKGTEDTEQIQQSEVDAPTTATTAKPKRVSKTNAGDTGRDVENKVDAPTTATTTKPKRKSKKKHEEHDSSEQTEIVVNSPKRSSKKDQYSTPSPTKQTKRIITSDVESGDDNTVSSPVRKKKKSKKSTIDTNVVANLSAVSARALDFID